MIAPDPVMNGLEHVLEAAVFDLDGVVTLTARVHFLAWKRLFDEVTRRQASRVGVVGPFDEQAYKRWVDGKPRIDGLRAYLSAAGLSIPEGSPADPASAETIMGLAQRKNAYFLELLEREGAQVDESAVALIRELRTHSVRIGLATSSKNAGTILRRAGLEELFDARVDGIESARIGLRGKPAPDIFLECARRLGDFDPSSVALFEDATAGVAAGRSGGFGLVVGVDRGESWIPLREHGADWIIRDFHDLGFDRIALWMLNRTYLRPNAIERRRELEARMHGRPLAVFLDYDGTLTPIVARPELALLPDETKEALRRLSASWPVAIVSGRGLEDLKEKVGLDSVWYAASHGFEIEGPGGSMRRRVVPELEPTIHRAAERLRRQVSRIPGAILEDKRSSITVHYRLVPEERARELERAVGDVLERYPGLRKTYGKKVLEIRADVDWNKGTAVQWLLEQMHVPGAVPIVAGDDTTDEDAFAAVAGGGIGVVVAELPRPTEARWSLQNPEEVRVLLDRIAALKVAR